ncbi:MAG: hypothetical protein WCR06_10640 [bacterium]
MMTSGHLRSIVRPCPLAGIMAVAGLLLAAATALRAGDGPDLAGASHTNHISASALPLWIDVPTNATRSDILRHTDLTSTNHGWSTDAGSALATSSTWRTTATIGTGFFHARNGGGPDCPGERHRSVDGWFQEVGVGMERTLDPADSGLSVGFGVSVGWLRLH